MRILFSCLVLLLSLAGCGKAPETRRVGVDPNWFPLEFGIRDHNVTGFSAELLMDIGKAEKIPFQKVSTSWNDLMDGLERGAYEAVLTSKTPYIFNRNKFDFSDIYLPLGPVLVVPKDSHLNSINQLSGKKIGVISGSNMALVLEKSEGVLIVDYDSIPVALNDVLLEAIDGALVDVLTATAFCRDLYQNTLKIATPPLNDEGLRMVSIHDKAPDLIKGFNAGLAKLKTDGTYSKLLDKWNLPETTLNK